MFQYHHSGQPSVTAKMVRTLKEVDEVAMKAQFASNSTLEALSKIVLMPGLVKIAAVERSWR